MASREGCLRLGFLSLFDSEFRDFGLLALSFSW
jgi:hypothetical protein